MKENKKRLSFNKTGIMYKTIIILGVIVVTLSVILVTIKINEITTIKTIKRHYNKTVITKTKANIFNKNKKKIGVLSKKVVLNLDKKKINKKEDTYFKIKNTNYYIYYNDVEKTKEKVVKDEINPNYLVWNNNIESKKKINFYKDNSKILELKDKISLKVEYSDDDYYYISFLDRLLKVNKKEVNLVDNENTKETESNYISIINYEEIKDKCNSETCIEKNEVYKELETLNKNGYYLIDMDSLNNYLKHNIRLKEKAILLTTNKVDNNDFINAKKIVLLSDEDNKRFVTNNTASNKDTDYNKINRYRIKDDTTIDDFKKMLEGQNVKEKEKVVIEKTSSSSEQKIAVLNYHFFYDDEKGEQCNENICEPVRDFRKHLDYLRDNGYKTLTMDEFYKWMYGKIELPQKSVLITVDDGAMGTGAHNGNKLIPILEEYKMHATLFLIAGWWDIKNYQSEYLDVRSHTYDMHNAGTCGKGQLLCNTKEIDLEDLKKSLDIIKNNDSFCFPFYQYNETSLQAVKEAGFKMSFIGGYRKAKRSDNKYLIPRYPIHKDTSLKTFISWVS